MKITINNIFDQGSVFKISPGKVKRDWMDDTDNHAYKCLPLNIANQHGWVAECPEDFVAIWDGGNELESIKIYPEVHFATSHFAYGILTINVDFLITTDKNISIYVKGVPNFNVKNLYPLEGIVETDWLPFTFTMNYKFHTPGAAIFKKGDPLFSFFPIERSFIESFKIESKPIKENEELFKKYEEYSNSRAKWLGDNTPGVQKYYIDKRVVNSKQDVYNHKTKIKLDRIEEE
jgi:hypothetical protein